MFICISFSFTQFSSFSRGEKWYAEWNKTPLHYFDCGSPEGRSVKTRGARGREGRTRNRERCPNWRVPREYFYQHQLHFSSPAVGDFSHYLNPEGKRKRSRWEEERHKGEVENSPPLFWWISYLRCLSVSSASRNFTFFVSLEMNRFTIIIVRSVNFQDKFPRNYN